MDSKNYLNQIERECLQEQTGSTVDSLADLRRLFYKDQTGDTSVSVNDLIRSYLKSETSSTKDDLNDLWRIFCIDNGITEVISLGDMMKQLWSECSMGTPKYIDESSNFYVDESGQFYIDNN